MLDFVIMKQPKVLRNKVGKAINFSRLLGSKTEGNSNLISLLVNVYSANTYDTQVAITEKLDNFKTKRDADIHPSSLSPSSLSNLKGEMRAARKMLHRHVKKGDRLSVQETAILDVLSLGSIFSSKGSKFCKFSSKGNSALKPFENRCPRCFLHKYNYTSKVYSLYSSNLEFHRLCEYSYVEP